MGTQTMSRAFGRNFLGHSPEWYKLAILAFLILNPIVMVVAGPFVAGWLVIGQFIFCLAMALRCYPLQPGGLLAIEAVILGLTSADAVYEETAANFPVILLLMFMVAGIYFMRELLLFVFTRVLLGIRSKMLLALTFCAMAAVLSAFIDALTVTAVIITVAYGFYLVFHRYASGHAHDDHSHNGLVDDDVEDLHRRDLEQFRAFLRSLVMHAVVGTALGGVITLVGEPQNLLIAKVVGWEFGEFMQRVAPVSMPVLAVGLATCVTVERFRWFGFGGTLPSSVRSILMESAAHEDATRSLHEQARIIVQATAAILLAIALATHVAEVGLIGLALIVLQTAFNGVIDEHRIGEAFAEALPFTALLIVFFSIVAIIHDQELFRPIVDHVLALQGREQLAGFYVANGALSAISDNVFVATVYISEVEAAFEAGTITQEQFSRLAVAVNAGTNIPSVATPNGQAAFLFLLTSALAPLIRLSYGRMVWMALPYTITMSITGFLAVVLWL